VLFNHITGFSCYLNALSCYFALIINELSFFVFISATFGPYRQIQNLLNNIFIVIHSKLISKMHKKHSFKVFVLLWTLNIVFIEGHCQSGFKTIFGKNTTSWSYIPNGFCDYVVSDSTHIKSHFTNKGLTYNIVTHKTDTVGLLREDTLNGKVWFRKSLSGSEYLISDLSLKMKDTFNLYLNPITVVKIVADSVFYLDMHKHIRLNYKTTICSKSESLEFIEGSCSNAGFLYQANGMHSYLLCSYQDGKKTSGNKLFNGSCNIMLTGLTEVNPDKSILPYPNPSQTKFHFELNNIHNDMNFISIYGDSGNLIFQEKTLGNHFIVDLGNYLNGLYFYQLTDKNGKSICGKLIKNN
jgi:hypothetical protein